MLVSSVKYEEWSKRTGGEGEGEWGAKEGGEEKKGGGGATWNENLGFRTVERIDVAR